MRSFCVYHRVYLVAIVHLIMRVKSAQAGGPGRQTYAGVNYTYTPVRTMNLISERSIYTCTLYSVHVRSQYTKAYTWSRNTCVVDIDNSRFKYF
jgi:hypothetical protein